MGLKFNTFSFHVGVETAHVFSGMPMTNLSDQI